MARGRLSTWQKVFSSDIKCCVILVLKEMEFNSHEIRVSEHSLSVGKVNEDCVMKSFGRNENSHQHCVSLEELLP